MKPIDALRLSPASTLRDALITIDSGGMSLALVVDPAGRLLGTLTDGDLRRGLIAGLALGDPVAGLVNREPVTHGVNDSREAILHTALTRRIYQIPIVDADGRVVGLEEVDALVRGAARDNLVVIMAGGQGTRLQPLTLNVPKPMLKVGPRPMLETIVESFVKYGFTRFAFCVNYRSNLIFDHFGDGNKFGVEIFYIEEKSPLGTAGALGLLPRRPAGPFLVINGDVLTNVNYGHLLERHVARGDFATMGVRDYEFQVPFGVVNLDGDRITAIDEKPVHRHLVSGGLYVLEPAAVDLIPAGQPFDMPSLFRAAIAAGRPVGAFPITDYWIDVGRPDDFRRANACGGRVPGTPPDPADAATGDAG